MRWASRAIKRLCLEQNPIGWQKAKLSPVLFKPYEQPVFEWVTDHLKHHHALPHVDTLHAQFPDTGSVETPEPSSYYVLQLEQQYLLRPGQQGQSRFADDPQAGSAASMKRTESAPALHP